MCSVFFKSETILSISFDESLLILIDNGFTAKLLLTFASSLLDDLWSTFCWIAADISSNALVTDACFPKKRCNIGLAELNGVSFGKPIHALKMKKWTNTKKKNWNYEPSTQNEKKKSQSKQKKKKTHVWLCHPKNSTCARRFFAILIFNILDGHGGEPFIFAKTNCPMWNCRSATTFISNDSTKNFNF